MQSLSTHTSGSAWPQIQTEKTATSTSLSTGVSIRRATVADTITISDMGRRLIPAAHNGALPTTDMNLYLRQSFSLPQIMRELRDPAACFWLAENGWRTAGMIKISPNSLPTTELGQRPVELSRLYLNPNWIGKGVGSALMQHALTQAASAGHDVCWLMVWAGNRQAQTFYRRWGFTATDTVNYPVGRSQLAAHVMIYQLNRFL